MIAYSETVSAEVTIHSVEFTFDDLAERLCMSDKCFLHGINDETMLRHTKIKGIVFTWVERKL